MGRFRSRLNAGELQIGAGVTFNDPLVSEALADSADFLWFDLEHMHLDPATLNAHLMAARGRRTPSFVRVRDVDAREVKAVRDAGAEGIVAPQVTTVEQVEELVANCRYPPVGRRGLFPRVPTNWGRSGGPEYFRKATREVFVAVMIETREAVAAIEDIVRIAGLVSVILRLGALSWSLGRLVDFDHPGLHECADRVLAAAQAVGMPVGAGAALDIGFVRDLVSRGVTWAQVGSDFEYMIRTFDDGISALRG